MCLKGVLGSLLSEGVSVGAYSIMLDLMLGDIDFVTTDVMYFPDDKAEVLTRV
jgi:hypothetical protein